MSQSQKLKRLNELIAKTQIFKYGNHPNISMSQSQKKKQTQVFPQTQP